MTQKHVYSAEEKEFIREYAYGHSHMEITSALNSKFGLDLGKNQISAYLKNHGIKTGRTGRFAKGHIPPNKGKHIPTIGRMAETQFKKGCIPQNHKPVGTLSIRCNYKRNRKYVYEKVAEPNVWRMKHVLVWESYYGPVPKDKIVIFADGNTLNTDISNLVLVSRSQNAIMNRWRIRGADKEHMEAAANVASLKSHIAGRKKALKRSHRKQK